jgi:hypothetical protein
MYVVALQFEKNAGDALAVRLAAVLGRTLLEARSRVSAPEGGPAVLATFAEARAAAAYADELRSRGFEVLVLPPEGLETESARFLVRSFSLGPESLTAQSRQGSIEIPWPDVRLLLRGATREVRTRTQTVQRRELSIGRAIATGGLLVSKPVKVTRQETEIVHEGFLHLYPQAGPPLVFRQSVLNYAGLGAELRHSVGANFQRLVTVLRAACPEGVFDERLATPPGQARLLGPSLSLESHLDVAVSLVSRALLARIPSSA